MELDHVLSVLNDRAINYRFGELKDIRKARRPLKRRPSCLPFAAAKGDWAHHVGGREELQFNVVWDHDDPRWGIAVSLQPSRSFPNITALPPKLKKLSRALAVHGIHLDKRGFTMWDWTGLDPNRQRSSDRPLGPIADHLYAWHTFLTLGKHAPGESFASSAVLRDFDTLLPIYEYVEFEPDTEPPRLHETRGFVFTLDAYPVGRGPPPRTSVTRTPDETHLSFKHRALQDALKCQLVGEGAEVRTEHLDGNGGYIDLVARQNGELEFYEIKSDAEARHCIRQRPPTTAPVRLFGPCRTARASVRRQRRPSRPASGRLPAQAQALVQPADSLPPDRPSRPPSPAFPWLPRARRSPGRRVGQGGRVRPRGAPANARLPPVLARLRIPPIGHRAATVPLPGPHRRTRPRA